MGLKAGKGSTMQKNKIVQVGSDGKAPKGLSSGDMVVTGGGTYQITGVNSDGSYKSNRVSDSTTSTYTGKYDSVSSSRDYNSGLSKDYSPSADAYSKYATTGGDIGLYGQRLMDAGADWKEVQQAWQDRYAKASTTDGLSQYANDDIQNAMWEYIQNAIKAENSQVRDEYMEDFEDYYNEEAPTYDNKYDPAIEEMLNKILNREDFSYDVTKDPLYQQYAAMYNQEGNRAMQETMANAAASAGGMNSYAITAAQQANNYYASQMANKVPELYQLAYEMYLQDKASMVEDLGLLQSMDNTQYNRYRDTMSDYYNDKNFAYGVYKDAVGQGNWQQTFDYNQLVTDRNYNFDVTQGIIDNDWKTKEWDNALSQQELENKRYDDALKREGELRAQEQAREEAYALLELGQMPPSALLQTAGIDEAYASAYIKGIAAQNANKSSGSTKSSSDSGYTGKKTGSDDTQKEDDTGYTGTSNTTSKDVTEHKDYNNGSVIGLGIGPVSNDTLETLIKVGGIVGDENGGFYWNTGWDANNYEDRLRALNGMGYLFTH